MRIRSITQTVVINLLAAFIESPIIKLPGKFLNTKIEKLEERFVQGQMENALFEKFKNKYQIEKNDLVKIIIKCGILGQPQDTHQEEERPAKEFIFGFRISIGFSPA